MINRKMLEETFGEEIVSKVIDGRGWNNNFDEKLKKEIYLYIIQKIVYYKAQIDFCNENSNNINKYELKNKIAQLEIVDKQNCKLKEEYDQGIISDAIQQIGFCYSSLPVGNINTDDIFTKIDIQPIEETIAIIKKLEEHKPL